MHHIGLVLAEVTLQASGRVSTYLRPQSSVLAVVVEEQGSLVTDPASSTSAVAPGLPVTAVAVVRTLTAWP